MWHFLDEPDFNLLYLYTKALGRTTRSKLQWTTEFLSEAAAKEERCRNAYYLIWFAYRYMMQCETLEAALNYANIETFHTYKLASLLKQRSIYIGTAGIKEIYLYREDEDIKTILEILYNRYNLMEQLECYIRNSGESRNSRSACIALKRMCQELLGKLNGPSSE